MPLAFLASGFGRAVMAAIAIAVLAAALYFQIRANGRIAGERDQVVAVNAGNLKTIAAKDAAAQRANAIAAAAAADAERLRKRFNAQRKDIANAPASDDGSVAPVLARVLDGLPGAAGDQARADPAAAAAGVAHDLPGRP